MKITLTTILILVTATIGFAQSKPQSKPAETAQAEASATSAAKDNPTLEAFTLYQEIKGLRAQQALCGYTPGDEKCVAASAKLVEDYQKAIRNPLAMNLLIGEAASNFDTVRDQAKGAAQVSQLADEQNVVLIRLMVMQNQRIIDLLEQLVKKK